MASVTPKEDRASVLRVAGVPTSFLEYLARTGDNVDAIFGLRDETAADYYLQRGLLSEETRVVTPLCSGANGDSFVLLLGSRLDGFEFVRASLEEGVEQSLGSNYQRVALEFMVDGFESRDWSEAEFLCAAGIVGFRRGQELYRSIVESDRSTTDSYREFMETSSFMFCDENG